MELKNTPGTASSRTEFSLISIFSRREYETTTISSMIAIITAKLAKILWRRVQFFTVIPRRAIQMEGSIAERLRAFIKAFDVQCTECRCARVGHSYLHNFGTALDLWRGSLLP
ncbi:hypothetical protein PFLmoz3_03454 [Pseudomonas fluorescens]|uniref:Uncharacterized protein n=1 Tax=Pseudomonas fluorescens TaxID=294 RepID=A0A109LGC7_PSEFL|nr:hypothetical protein PFLmoz3_03454 [Pseudomonas fluorescens]